MAGAQGIPVNGVTWQGQPLRILASGPNPKYPALAADEPDLRPGVEVLPSKDDAASELTADVGTWRRTNVVLDLLP